MKTNLKSQKPIEIDAHFKYRCPNTGCGCFHWLSLKECQTKNFKTVCDCGEVFKVKLIDELKILYTKKKIVKSAKDTDKMTIQQIPIDLLRNCVKILVGYGFSESESEELIKNIYAENQITDCAVLIKKSLESIRG